MLGPPLLWTVNPVKEVAQQVGLLFEHVVLVVHVEDARPVGPAGVVTGPVAHHMRRAILWGERWRGAGTCIREEEEGNTHKGAETCSVGVSAQDEKEGRTERRTGEKRARDRRR